MTDMVNEVRVCSACGLTKPLDEYYKSKKGKMGRHSWCRVCMRTHMNAFARCLSPEEKTYWNRRKKLAKKYELKWSDYQLLLKDCHNRCSICCAKVTLGVDHSHQTGKVRGLLCNKCNTGLGQFQDSPALLFAAANYLLLHS